jgi:hypothetical protein
VVNIFFFASTSQSFTLNTRAVCSPNVCNVYQTTQRHIPLYSLYNDWRLRQRCISVGHLHTATISPGCPMANQLHGPRSASRWPAIKRPTEAKCCIFYKTRRNISLCCRSTCQGEPQYTWVQAQLTTALSSNTNKRTLERTKLIKMFLSFRFVGYFTDIGKEQNSQNVFSPPILWVILRTSERSKTHKKNYFLPFCDLF